MALLAFFDFPVEHRDHLPTAIPIESIFTVRDRTVRAKGALLHDTICLIGLAHHGRRQDY
ncbi:hypothetical protein [Consotaella salsifontis]|uniref:hypothetical protein n=1 Tax=Consotaella salsifontis TaxID=1365950 RepID=UPI000998FF70|nr:hypothetical protein [Consotaella salsifontis]